jgi:uncharacterized metal-binding protein
MENSRCSGPQTVLFTCSGAANVGQIANQAAMELQTEGTGSMLCLAAVAGCDEKIIKCGKNAERVVGIDGCSSVCTKKTLEQAGISLTDHITVTDLCLEKKPCEGMPDANAVTRVKNAVKARLESVAGGYG